MNRFTRYLLNFTLGLIAILVVGVCLLFGLGVPPGLGIALLVLLQILFVLIPITCLVVIFTRAPLTLKIFSGLILATYIAAFFGFIHILDFIP